jgi:arylsulfatase A-like enzyme
MLSISRLLVCILLFLPLTTTEARADAAHRSVVLIVIDSLRADHLQTYGYRRDTSGEILAFSRNATVFTYAYPGSNWTRPSIQSLMTGRFPAELSANPGGGTPLKDGHPTLATALKSYGYETAGFYNTAQLVPSLANIGGFDRWVDYGGTSGKDLTAAFVAQGVDRSLAFLRGARRPAFLFLHILDPHHPYLPSRNYYGATPVGKFRSSFDEVLPTGPPTKDAATPCLLAKDPSQAPQMNELYDSEIREMDQELGRLLRFLQTDARYRDALVIITADHGEEFAEHGGLYHGARFFEESVRVPLIIRDPARPYSRGRRVDSIVSLVDVAPTVMQAVSLPADDTHSGKSLVEYLARRGGVRRDTVFIDKPTCGYDGIVAVRHGDWKLIAVRTRDKVQLYNLATDPAEKHDRSAEKTPDVNNELIRIYALFDKWERTVNRPLAMRNGDATPQIPPDLLARLKALGYLK